MKVLLVTDQQMKVDGENILGSENFTNIIKRLSVFGEIHICLQEYKDDKNKIQVFNDLMNDYIEKQNLRFIKKSYIWPSKKTIDILNAEIANVDLVIGYVPALNAEIAELLAHKAGKKYFALMVACPWDGLWNQDWKRKIAAPYRFLMNRQVLCNADYALYVTNKFLQNRYPTKGKSVGISNVVLDECRIETLNERLDRINNFELGGTVKIATTATLNVRYKGQRFVIKALKKLKELGYNNYHYFLIGGGDNTVLLNQAKKLGVEDQVHFVGKITHEEVFRLLDDIDIYIHPSLQEGLPRSVVEAMSRGLPCIGARTAAIPELLDNNFVVKRKSVDEIVEKILILTDKETLTQQAQRNFEEARKYECKVLDERRNMFYEAIKSDFDQN